MRPLCPNFVLTKTLYCYFIYKIYLYCYKNFPIAFFRRMYYNGHSAVKKSFAGAYIGIFMNVNNMDIKLIAERIKCIREDLDISVEEMASLCEMSVEKYRELESGNVDFTFSFLNRCAVRFGVDISALMTGSVTAYLKTYAIERKGSGLRVDRRKDFQYLHLASRFYNHRVDPLYVVVPYSEEALNKPIDTNTHEGQEFDYVLEGELKYVVGNKTEYLSAGDSIILDSSIPHGMVAASKGGCKFLAIVIKK